MSGIYSGLTSSLLGIAVTNGFVLPSLQALDQAHYMTYSVYYYYYEFTKSIITKARTGNAKALSTLESMLAGLIAGLHLHSQCDLLLLTCHLLPRLCDNNNFQPHLGDPNDPGRSPCPSLVLPVYLDRSES